MRYGQKYDVIIAAIVQLFSLSLHNNCNRYFSLSRHNNCFGCHNAILLSSPYLCFVKDLSCDLVAFLS